MTAADGYGRHAARVQEPTPTYKTEPKVKASAGAATAAAGLITPVLVRVIDDLFLDGDGPATLSIEYVGLLSGAVVAACSWAAGWLAPHVDRLRESDS